MSTETVNRRELIEGDLVQLNGKTGRIDSITPTVYNSAFKPVKGVCIVRFDAPDVTSTLINQYLANGEITSACESTLTVCHESDLTLI